MKIAILNGSPKVGNTAAMVNAFAEGAKEAGHEVEILHVGKMKINGCLACEFCHGKGAGTCVQKDDMEKVMPAYKEADMVVFASPIYYYMIYDFKITTGRGETLNLADYKGKVIMVINTATGCGFTPQYAPIEQMYKDYHDQGLEILDIPCNQFGGQAPVTPLTPHRSINPSSQIPRMLAAMRSRQ